MLKEAAFAVAEHAAKGVLGEVNKTGADLFKFLLGNRLSEWNTRNLVNLCQETHEKFARRGIDISQARSLPNAEIYAIFEGASQTDDPDLTELWASLLASAMEPEGQASARVAYTSALANMDGHDARMLRSFVQFRDLCEKYRANERSNDRKDESKRRGSILDADTIISTDKIVMENRRRFASETLMAIDKELPADHPEFETTKSNLIRLDLLRSKPRPIQSPSTTGVRNLLRSSRDLRELLALSLEEQKRDTHKLLNSALGRAALHAQKGPLFHIERFGFLAPLYELTDLGEHLATACGIGSYNSAPESGDGLPGATGRAEGA